MDELTTTKVNRPLLIGTGNDSKFREIEQLLCDLPFQLLNLSHLGLTKVEETGATYADNANLKANTYAQSSNLWTVAEDSGLEVVALNRAPGIYSARHAGRLASSLERNQKILSNLNRVTDDNRIARFVCVAVLASPDGRLVHSTEGICSGSIATKPRGTNGFGYDSIFIPEGFTNTFGELPTQVKQRISHRARAIAKMRELLVRFFDDQKMI